MRFDAVRDRGVQSALLAAALFGSGTPLAKLMVDDTSPWILAGLLYCGSGFGLLAYRLLRRSPAVRLARADRLPLAGAIGFGGVLAPVLLLAGLANLPASGSSLLLNAEGAATALLAWFLFGENVERRVALGMTAIIAGAVVLSVPSGASVTSIWPATSIIGACVCWGLDNNLTRMVALNDATWLASVKGLVAGPVNLAIGLAVGGSAPGLWRIAPALVVGFLAYGVSLTLFIVGMRHVGTARAGAYFSIAPFFGAVLAVCIGEPVTVPLVVAGLLMGLGVWLHLTERHEHRHTHEAMEHDHLHVHDEHHQHEHDDDVPAGTPHRHRHVHTPMTHSHPHFPDAHHRHSHDA